VVTTQEAIQTGIPHLAVVTMEITMGTTTAMMVEATATAVEMMEEVVMEEILQEHLMIHVKMNFAISSVCS